MSGESDPMEKFLFLLGTWHLTYHVPQSRFSQKDEGEGTGEIKRLLNKFVSFDYLATLGTGTAAAHGVFAWDEKVGIYRYWWFEDSGAFMTATCHFVDENTLRMNWHDTLLVQTFRKQSPDKIVLHMRYPAGEEDYELVLKVVFTRR